MKTHGIVLVVLSILVFSSSFAFAAFDLPGYVLRIDQLEQAREQAKSDDKQIVFFYSNEHTDCPLAAKASIGIMEKFRHKAVIVYVGKGDWEKVPQIVRKAMSSPEAGKFIPKTVVVDSAITEVVSIIPYKRPGT